jgi:integrase
MPRRQRGEGSIWQRKSDGLWMGAIDVGYANGRRRRKVVSSKKQSEVVRKLREARKAIDSGNLTTSTMKTDVWLRYWLDEIASLKVKPRTLQDYRSKAETYLIPQLGHHRLDKLTPVHVRALHKWMREQGLSETTVTHTHWLLVGALKAAMSEVGLNRNVAALVDAPTMAKHDGRALTPAECLAVLNAAGEDRARWQFALYTGTRQGEALGLQWDRVNLTEGWADISWALQRIPYTHGCDKKDGKPTCKAKRPNGCPQKRLQVPPGMEWQQLDGNLCLVRPKTARSVRFIDLTPGVVHALRELHARDGVNPHGLVWHREDGKPIDGRTDYKSWLEIQRRAGVEPIPVHGTRHTTATLMQSSGTVEPVMMQVLGHTLATTTRGYVEVDRTLTRAAMEAVADAIEG